MKKKSFISVLMITMLSLVISSCSYAGDTSSNLETSSDNQTSQDSSTTDSTLDSTSDSSTTSNDTIRMLYPNFCAILSMRLAFAYRFWKANKHKAFAPLLS